MRPQCSPLDRRRLRSSAVVLCACTHGCPRLRPFPLPPKGRYIFSPETRTLLEMADDLREKYSQYPLPRKNLPKFLVYLVGPLMASLSWHFIRHNIDVPMSFSVEKAKKELDFEFRPVKQGERERRPRLVARGARGAAREATLRGAARGATLRGAARGATLEGLPVERL